MQSQFPVVPIRDQEIRLGQFIKLANLVETGGMAKELIAAGYIQVNGHVDTRRGKALRDGDVVTVLSEPIEGQDATPNTNSDSTADAGVDVVAGAVVAAPGGQTIAQSGVAAAADDGLDDDLGEYFDEATADDDFDPEKWRNL